MHHKHRANITTTNTPDACNELAAIERDELSRATGGFDVRKFAKNYAKSAVNGVIDYENAVLPDQVGGWVSYNIPQIPRPFHDNPSKKLRHQGASAVKSIVHDAIKHPVL